MLPDRRQDTSVSGASLCLNAPTGAWCSLTWPPTTSLSLISRLNAPTGAWCSLTPEPDHDDIDAKASQCTYRCVVLPDHEAVVQALSPLESQCTYRCVVLPDWLDSNTSATSPVSQCTYRCVVLPDHGSQEEADHHRHVSMHLQVRGAP